MKRLSVIVLLLFVSFVVGQIGSTDNLVRRPVVNLTLGELDTRRNWHDGRDIYRRVVQFTGATADVVLDLGAGPIQVIRAEGYGIDDGGTGTSYQIGGGGVALVDPLEAYLYWSQTSPNRAAGDMTLVIGGADLIDNGGVTGEIIVEYVK